VSEISGDVSSGYGGRDIWVIEINNNGELVNEASFGGSQNDIYFFGNFAAWTIVI
jgi:hypothetical protein